MKLQDVWVDLKARYRPPTGCTCEEADVTTFGDSERKTIPISDPSCPRHGVVEMDILDDSGNVIGTASGPLISGQVSPDNDLVLEPGKTYNLRYRQSNNTNEVTMPIVAPGNVSGFKIDEITLDEQAPEVECVICEEVKPLKTSTWNEHDYRHVGWWCHDCRAEAGFEVKKQFVTIHTPSNYADLEQWYGDLKKIYNHIIIDSMRTPPNG